MKQELCAALGDFDGVHLGHIAVINTAVKYCDTLTPAVYTFSHNCKNAKLITDNLQKEAFILSLGIKKVIFDDFDLIKDFTPLQFVKEILLDKYNIKTVVCGKDFRFGKNATGDVDVLEKLCDDYGISLITVDGVNIDGNKISSTDIRLSIESGDMENVARLLGRYFSVSGTVAHGKGLGHTKKTPTVNITFKDNVVIPAFGVYITKTEIDGVTYNSISNVGIRPSVENTSTPNLETNIFDFDSDIYGKSIKISFIKMLRSEMKFDSSDKLFEQINKDILKAKEFFSEENSEKIY